jgi:hypothetical protein
MLGGLAGQFPVRSEYQAATEERAALGSPFFCSYFAHWPNKWVIHPVFRVVTIATLFGFQAIFPQMVFYSPVILDRGFFCPNVCEKNGVEDAENDSVTVGGNTQRLRKCRCRGV